MAKRNAQQTRLIKKIIWGLVLFIAGSILLYDSYYRPNMSWERLNWLMISIATISTGLALFASKDNLWSNISRIFIGIIFIYSGFVKTVDPLGFVYKMTDYFDAWHIQFLEPYALPMAILIIVSEFLVGIALFFNLFTQYASIGALVFMIYFTPVTLYLALQQNISGKELVHDCGCFGDALILTNWQTFIKNIVLLIPSIILFRHKTKILPVLLERSQIIILGIFTVFILSIAYWGLEHLPIIDYRPYKIGTNIPEKMQIPSGAPQPKYEYHLFYKNTKTGETKEFSLENYPKDSTWTFVDTKNVLIEEGYIPPIHDFTIVNRTEGDITDMVLSDPNYNFLLIAYDINKTNDKHIAQIKNVYNWCLKNGIPFRCLTSSVDRDIEVFKKRTGLNVPFYNTDQITLKTIVRSNPGLVLLKAGTVIDMWHHNDIPEVEYFSSFIKK